MIRSLAIAALASGCISAHAYRHPGQKMPTSAYVVDCTATALALGAAVDGYPGNPALTTIGIAAFFAVWIPPAFAPGFVP